MLYTYQAQDARGRRVCGHRQVEDYDGLREYLERKGLTEFKIFPSRTLYSPSRYRYVKPRELAAVCSRLSAAFGGGAASAAEIVASESERCSNRQLKTALSEMAGIMSKGFSVAEAFGMYGHVFTNYTVSVVNLGEMADNLAAAFGNLASFFAEQARRGARIRRALTAPAVSFGGVAIVSLLTLRHVLPALRDAAESAGATD